MQATILSVRRWSIMVLLHNVELYGSHAKAHLSDAWRILTNYKKGGYYFDLDVIYLQLSSESPRTDMGLEFVAAGAFHIQYKHPIQLALDEFRNTNMSSVKYMVTFKQLIKSNIIHFIFETTYNIYMVTDQSFFTNNETIVWRSRHIAHLRWLEMNAKSSEFSRPNPSTHYPGLTEKRFFTIQDSSDMEREKNRDPRLEQNDRSTSCI